MKYLLVIYLQNDVNFRKSNSGKIHVWEFVCFKIFDGLLLKFSFCTVDILLFYILCLCHVKN